MSDAAPPRSSERSGENPTAGRGARPKILVLDDEWEICEAVDDVLRGAGFEPVCLTDGASGLDYLLGCEHPPAAIVLDLMMPRMDGWRFFDRLHADDRLKDIPIIVLTAVGPHWGYPVARVLRKPIDQHELVSAVREAVEGRDEGVSTHE